MPLNTFAYLVLILEWGRGKCSSEANECESTNRDELLSMLIQDHPPVIAYLL